VLRISIFNYQDSLQFLDEFQSIEQETGMNAYGCVVEDAQYIWVLADESPVGFLAYRENYPYLEQLYIQIDKVYVLKTHCGKAPTFVDGKRVSEILFKKVESLGKDLLKLESASEKLDKHYEQKFGFKPFVKGSGLMFKHIVNRPPSTEENIAMFGNLND
jgi:hypothetical protein